MATGAGRRRGIATAVAQRLAETSWDSALRIWTATTRGCRGGWTLAPPGNWPAACALSVRAPARSKRTSLTSRRPGSLRAGAPGTGAGRRAGAGALRVGGFRDHGYRPGVLRPAFRGQHARRVAADPRVRPAVPRTARLGLDHRADLRSHGREPALRRVEGRAGPDLIAAASELSGLGVTANCVNPGPTDNCWMSRAGECGADSGHPARAAGQLRDAANLVAFLCSADGGWVNGQLIHSNGGLRS